MRPKLFKTEDGSHSLYLEELNEPYHSIHGAIQESNHVFIEAGLKKCMDDFKLTTSDGILNILEIGFGTGLNAFLTGIESSKMQVKIDYTGIEPLPLDVGLITQLNYSHLLAESAHAADYSPTLFEKIHSSEWNLQHQLSTYFNLTKLKYTLQEAPLQNSFHLVYFDAFGPSVQPEMWTVDVFLKLFHALLINGSLVTYCAKGSVKRMLKDIGFEVEPLPGPPGKREMIRARKYKC